MGVFITSEIKSKGDCLQKETHKWLNAHKVIAGLVRLRGQGVTKRLVVEDEVSEANQKVNVKGGTNTVDPQAILLPTMCV